jgi:hypothetical protein
MLIFVVLMQYINNNTFLNIVYTIFILLCNFSNFSLYYITTTWTIINIIFDILTNTSDEFENNSKLNTKMVEEYINNKIAPYKKSIKDSNKKIIKVNSDSNINQDNTDQDDIYIVKDYNVCNWLTDIVVNNRFVKYN